jgi:hypothetical protein
VNVSPSLVGSSPLDRKIKGLLMTDVFHCVGFVPYDGKQVRGGDDYKHTETRVMREG